MRVFVTLILLGTVVLFPSGCAVLNSGPRIPSPADSAAAKALLQLALTEYWRDALTRRSDLALANGVPVSRIPDDSRLDRKGDLRLAQRVGRGLDIIDVAALGQPDYLTTLALRWEVDAQAEGAAFEYVDYGVLSPVTSPVRELTEIFRLSPLASVADAERYLYFVMAFPFVVERINSSLEARRERGYGMPRAVVQSAITFYRGLIALGDSGPWSPAPSRLAVLDSAQRRVFDDELALAVHLQIIPALDSLATRLEKTYLPEASDRPGLWQYPGGKELYRHLLRRSSSLDIPPLEAHRVGLGELRRIDSTMAELRRRQRWNPDPVAFHDSLRRAIGVAPSLDTVIARMEGLVAAMRRALSAELAGDPPGGLVIRAATPAESLLWPEGSYLPPEHVGDSVATLLLTDRWRQPDAQLSLASRTYRLTLPGRHLEVMRIRRDSTIQPVRQQMDTPGFADGWSQYAASLAGEMGMYADPLDAYGRLLDEGRAMALLVVDTGIHYLGWSTQQGRQVLGRYMLASDAEVDQKIVERVLNEPGRAGAGALGAREVAAMRAWMRGELGGDFDPRAWHHEMLSLGELPLPIVGSHLEWWLYDVRRRAAEAQAAAARAEAERAAAERAAKKALGDTTVKKRPIPQR